MFLKNRDFYKQKKQNKKEYSMLLIIQASKIVLWGAYIVRKIKGK
jgi:hypothetical protein